MYNIKNIIKHLSSQFPLFNIFCISQHKLTTRINNPPNSRACQIKVIVWLHHNSKQVGGDRPLCTIWGPSTIYLVALPWPEVSEASTASSAPEQQEREEQECRGFPGRFMVYAWMWYNMSLLPHSLIGAWSHGPTGLSAGETWQIKSIWVPGRKRKQSLMNI